jgi:predicted ATPase
MAAAALDYAEQLDDAKAQLLPLYLTWSSQLHIGDCRAAQQTAARLTRVALRLDDTEAMMLAGRLTGAALLLGGNLHEARTTLARALERTAVPRARMYPPGSTHNQHLLARTLLAMGSWLEGFADRAAAEIEACLGEAAGENNRFTLCSILRDAACRIAIVEGDLATAEQRIARLIDIAAANSHRPYLQTGRCFEGMLLINRGELERGTAALRGALDDCRATGWTTFFPEFLGVLAAGLGELGDVAAGLATIAEALARAQDGGELWYVPELLRIKGELLRLQGSAERAAPAAEHPFRAGLAAAREQGALSWELRAASSLARLELSRDRPDAARDVLAPVLARFTEGFATADLRAAQALLAGLPPRR